MRCADHHWLQDARWRKVYVEMESGKENTTDKPLSWDGLVSAQDDLDSQDIDYSTIQQEVLANDLESKENIWKRINLDINLSEESIVSSSSSMSTEFNQTAEENTTTMPEIPTHSPRKKDILILIFVSYLYNSSLLGK